MKALTVCQPYAFLFCLPDSDPRKKRVENRSWPTRHRGPLAIHAGKSKEWLEREDILSEEELRGLEYGAVVGVCNLIDCLHIDQLKDLPERHPLSWVKTHRHSEGPYLWIVDYCQEIEPVATSGALGLWEWNCPIGILNSEAK